MDAARAVPSIVSVVSVVAAALAVVTAAPAPARASDRLQFGVASEFGRGLGAGFELGEGDVLVVGAGAAGALGYSPTAGWVGFAAPGLAVGLRRYLGRWYLGPSAGLNWTVAASDEFTDGEWDFTLLADAGYRWTWGARREWNTRLGGGLGVALWPGDAPEPAGSLTLGLGFDL